MKKSAISFLLLFAVFSVIEAQIKEGDLIKGSKENIYLVIDNKACWIPSKEIFEALKFDWKAVKPVEERQLNKMEKGALIFLNKAGNYYLTLNNRIALIGDAKMFKALGLSEKFVRNLPDAELARLVRIPFLLKGGKADKYIMTGGKICRIPSDKTFKALGLDSGSVTAFSDKIISGLIKAPLLVKGESEKVFLIEKDKRRWISSEEVFKKNKYNWSAVYKLDDKTLTAIPEGPPVK